MPKDDREILTGIRTGAKVEGNRRTKGRVITDPDELEAAGLDLQALHEAGAITGTWKGVKAAGSAQAEEDAEPAKSGKKGAKK